MSMQSIIETKIRSEFTPNHLEVLNESYMHRGPAEESHFKLILVSEKFEGQRLLARHRAVNAILAEELAGTLHALALHTYTPAEWLEQKHAPKTPSCLG